MDLKGLGISGVPISALSQIYSVGLSLLKT